MGTLAQIQEHGLTDEFATQLANFFTDKASEDVKSEIEKLIDDNGLKSPAVMKAISARQKDGSLNPGLYKELVKLNGKMTSNGETTAASSEALTLPEGAKEVIGEDGEKTYTFSEKQEDRIKTRMEAEREKATKRLLEKELKIRERLAGRAEKRAQRLGIKSEEAVEIQALKEQIQGCREAIKVQRQEIKVFRARILEIRPKRSRKTKSEDDTAPAETE